MQGYLNRKIVCFLGAGASACQGYPLMQGFLDEVKASFVSGDEPFVKRRQKAFKTLLAFRSTLSTVRDLVNTDFDNIESLYSAAEMFALAFPDNNITVDNESITPTELLRQIGIAIWEICRWRPFEGRVHRVPTVHQDLLRSLVGKPPHEELRNIVFITTNYDLVPEIAAWLEELPFSYGESVNFTQQDGDFGKHKGGLTVLKLHGSVNWFTDGSKTVMDGTILTFPGPDPGHMRPGQEAEYYTLQHRWPALQSRNYEIPDGLGPLIVPPTFVKSPDIGILRSIWKEATQALAEAKMIVFIGYSFPRTDTFVHHMLNVGLLRNPDLRKVVVIDRSQAVSDVVAMEVFNRVFSSARVVPITEPFGVHAVAELVPHIIALKRTVVA